MAVWSEVLFEDVARSTRFDAEYYQPKFLRYDAMAIKSGGALSKFVPRIIQPNEFIREYVEAEEGMTFWRAQNVRCGYVDADNVEYIDFQTFEGVKNAHVEEGDILITRTGANAGDCAVVPPNTAGVAVSSHTLRLIPKSVEMGYAIGGFFASDFGRDILFRSVSGSSRPQITKEMLNALVLPDFSSIADEMASIIRAAYAKRAASKTIYAEAEALLLDALGLNDLDATHAITYERNFAEVARAGRYDAEYFHTRYVGVIDAVKAREHALLRRHAQAHSGYPWKSEYFLESGEPGEPFIRIRDCKPGTIDNAELSRLDAEYAIGERAVKAEASDLVVGMDGVNYFYASLLRESCFVNQRVCRVALHVDAPFSAEYALLVLNSRVGQSQLLREKTIAQTVAHITNENVRDLLIPLLPDGLRADLSRMVKESIAARDDAQSLLEQAKRRVEDLIEEGA